MTLNVSVDVNGAVIGSVEITNQTGGTTADSVNTYAWTYLGEGDRKLNGLIDHRYGDGALVLAANVVERIARRYQLVAHLDHTSGDVPSCPMCAEVAHV